jgi:hypothetical protein
MYGISSCDVSRREKSGLPMPFDSFMQAIDHLRNADGKLPDIPIIKIAWNEKIPADATGFLIEESKMRHTPSDNSIAGTRIFA